MDLDSIVTIIVAVGPSVIAIGTAIGSLLSILKQFNELKQSVKDSTETKQFRAQLERILKENAELKENFNQLMEYSKKHPVIKSKED